VWFRKSENITASKFNSHIPRNKNDEFYDLIQRIAREEDIKTVLEIVILGSSAEAF